MESGPIQAEGGRYSPPVSPRTVSSEPSPNIAIPGDDYFLDNTNTNGDSRVNTQLPFRQRSPPSDSERRLSQPSRQRPPALQLATDYKLEAMNSRPLDLWQQILSPRNTKRFSAVSLDIRPLDDLLNERSYLLLSLQKQDERATALFKRYAALEAQLAESQAAKEARKIRKDAKLLKHKITESTQQEQLIFLRLGEIYIEIHNRERWMKFRHQQPAAHPMPVYFPPLYYGTGEVVSVPPPPPTPVAAAFSHHFSSIPPATPVNHHYPPYLLTPYIVPQPSPPFSYSNASPLTPFSPEFVTGVSFSKDIWGRPGFSPRLSAPSNIPQYQNQYPLQVNDENRQLEPRGAETSAQEDEYPPNQRQQQQQQQQEEQHYHDIIPWHQLRHNTQGTSTPNNTQDEDEDESDDTMFDDASNASEES